MKDTNSLGGRIAALRKEFEYTQADLANQLDGFNRDHITKLESGNVKHPKRELMAQLVTVLNTSYEWLELGQGDPHPMKAQVNGREDYIEKLICSLESGNLGMATLLRSEIRRVLQENDQLRRQNEEFKENIVEAIRKIDESG